MQIILSIIALVALALMIIPALLFCAGQLEHATVKQTMLAATVLWFAAVLPLRFRRGAQS